MVKWILVAWLSLSAFATTSTPSLYQLPGQWKDDLAHDLSLAQFRGHWVIATLAYAHCRSVCSMTVESLKKVERELGANGNQIEFVLFSIDPSEDQPDVMRTYLTRKNVTGERWHFLAGDLGTTRKVAAALSMAFGEKSARGAHIMHTFKLGLISPDGKVLETMDSMKTHEFSEKVLAAFKKVES